MSKQTAPYSPEDKVVYNKKIHRVIDTWWDGQEWRATIRDRHGQVFGVRVENIKPCEEVK